MSETVFKDVRYDLNSLVQYIELGEIGLPDIQRPFIWKNAKVRDLFDSMYKGYPIGYLLFWQNGFSEDSRTIGTDSKQKIPRLLIVDGQQRAAAVRDAAIEKFPLCVVGFIAATLAEQREQFILVNSTKPLPKSLVHELLPAIDGKLPSALARRRFPAYLMDRLNHDEDSPFRGWIKTATAREGVIQDNSVLRMVENSLTDGALYRFRGRTDEDNDVAAMLSLLKGFWTAAADVFSNAWGISPKRSRLMHGAGIVSMGFVMDAIADQVRHLDRVVADDFVSDLRELAPACRWTDGFWNFGPGVQRRWNEIQNTSTDVRLLTNYLLVTFRQNVNKPVSIAG